MNPHPIATTFTRLFGGQPLLVRSPGRINLIGEHTDYNEGFVLPAAIDKEMILAVGRNGLDRCRLYSLDYQQQLEVPLQELRPSQTGWANYLLGVVDQLQKAGYPLQGFDCVFGGDIPMGAGLSSSAALECGTAFALSELFDLRIDRQLLIRFAQKAEHTFAGVQCGIMDQFASVMGKEGHALQLDCRSLDYTYFPLQLQEYQLILLDTQVKHSLASSEYNTRRLECEQGVAAVRRRHPHVQSLRDVSPAMLQEAAAELPPLVMKRCRYVLDENERLLQGCELLKMGDIPGFGHQMWGSHAGLSSQYEVSCSELDFLVNFAKEQAGVAGARMMGGGFGGCTLNLVKSANKEAFLAAAGPAYLQAFGIALKHYEVAIRGGTSILNPDQVA
ncbi:galactokinase [Cesiribacter andamanensis]|uniref:Galactokinase n=1 Tax=Cesiribacter andamanensis AMV16 TaxID=1279009 RepID=M7NXJ2_9BACT|nr:galactokinase [Cesiribacter andamanensis]EMR03129.1 Galactokinase [Cesiribacter andamanensis AMV16]